MAQYPVWLPSSLFGLRDFFHTTVASGSFIRDLNINPHLDFCKAATAKSVAQIKRNRIEFFPLLCTDKRP